MKNVHIILPLLVVSVIAACNKKDNIPTGNFGIGALELKNAQLIFAPDGGKDTIRVFNGKGLTAAPGYNWCETRVIGDTLVEVKVNAYAGLESRFCQIAIKSPDTYNSVVIQQSGVYIQNFDDSDLALKNGAREIKRTFNSNATFSATTEADWIHLTCAENELTINVDENETKQFREGWVAWAVGELKDTIDITQFDAVDAGMMGAYTWKGRTVKNNRDWSINASLTQGEEDTYSLNLTSNTYNLSIPVTMDKQTLLLPLGNPIGTYTTSKGVVHTVIPVIAQGTAAIKYADVTTSGNYKLVFERTDSGKWVATADHSDYTGYNFQFANWLKTDDYLSVNSQTNGIYLQNITLEQN